MCVNTKLYLFFKIYISAPSNRLLNLNYVCNIMLSLFVCFLTFSELKIHKIENDEVECDFFYVERIALSFSWLDLHYSF